MATKVLWYAKEFRKHLVEDGIVPALDVTSLAVQRRLQSKLDIPGRGKKHGKYRSSAPWDPPALQTGNLQNSVQIDRTHIKTKYKVQIGTHLEYGRVLEYGERRNLLPRPWLQPVWDRMHKVVHNQMKRLVAKSINRFVAPLGKLGKTSNRFVAPLGKLGKF